MIEFNITIIFQICHFLIAYTLLRVFLWKPVIKHIDEQQKNKDRLEGELVKQEQIVEQKEFALNRLWRNAERSFIVHTPPLVRHGGIRKEIEYQVKEPKVSSEMVRSLADDIVKKVQS